MIRSLESTFKTLPSRIVLPNGLTLVSQQNDSTDLMSIQLWVKTGSIDEGKYLGSGISHFVEHMLFKGTERRDYLTISTEAQHKGASLNAYTTFDRTVYTFDGPNSSLDLGMDLLADMAFHSTFPIHEFQKERDVVLREIDMVEDDPEQCLSQCLFETAFRKHPYRFPILGLRSVFENLTRDNLIDYWKKRYIPNNMTLVVVSPAPSKIVHQTCKKYFSHQERKSLEPVCIPEEPFQLALREARFYGDYHLVRGALTFKIPGLSHKNNPGLQVLANLLGSGYSALLYQKLREELQIVHDIEAYSWNSTAQGLFWISYTCDADKRKIVEDAIKKELFNFAKNGVSSENLEKALNQSIVCEIDSRKTVHGKASRIGMSEVIIGDLNYPLFYFERLKKLKVDSVKKVIEKYLKEDTMTMVSLEPKENKIAVSSGKKSTAKDFPVTSYEFSNGAKLVVQQLKNFPKCHVKSINLGGPIYETQSTRGISYLLSTLLIKDTDTRSSQKVAQELENVGGHFHSIAGNNSINVSVETLSKDFDLAADIMFSGIQKPLLLEKVFKHEKEAQLAYIKEEMDEIFSVGFRRLRKEFFGKHPYSSSPIGNENTLSHITIEDIKNHYQKIICGNNSVISVVSPFEPKLVHEKLSPKIEKFSNIKFHSAKEVLENINFAQGQNTIVSDKEQSLVFQAYPMCGVIDEDFIVTDLLYELLSGLSSDFIVEVREKRGLAYTVGSGRMVGLKNGMFYLYAGTNENYMHVVQEEMFKAIKRIQQGKFGKREIESCKNHLKVQHKSRLQSISQMALDAGLHLLYGMPLESIETYNSRVDDISPDRLIAYVQAIMDPSSAFTLFVSSKRHKG